MDSKESLAKMTWKAPAAATVPKRAWIFPASRTVARRFDGHATSLPSW